MLRGASTTPNIDEELERVATFRPQGQKKRAPKRNLARGGSPEPPPPMPYEVELQPMPNRPSLADTVERHSRFCLEQHSRSSQPRSVSPSSLSSSPEMQRVSVGPRQSLSESSRSVSPAAMQRMGTEERLSFALAVSIETEEIETNARQDGELAEQLALAEALEESRSMALMSPEERCAAAEVESRHIELAEPPLKTPEDVPLWHAWAEEHTEHHRRMVHPREYDQRGHPSSKPLSLWTSRREIGRQFGAGVELYLELLDLCLKACLFGGAVYAYSLHLNVGQGMSMDVEYGSGAGDVHPAAPSPTLPHPTSPTPSTHSPAHLNPCAPSSLIATTILGRPSPPLFFLYSHASPLVASPAHRLTA